MRRNKRKGVGYTTGVGKTFAVSQYIKNKKSKAEQTAYLIDILSSFFRTKDWVPPQSVAQSILKSVLLPLIENALRAGSLVDIVKFDNLYISYLWLIRVFFQNKKLSEALMEINAKSKQNQIYQIYQLLEQIYDKSQTYTALLQSSTPVETERDSKYLF